MKYFEKLSRGAVKILSAGLPAVALALIRTAAYTSSLDTYGAARYYPVLRGSMEHILMSLMLTVVGALLYDIAVKRQGG